MFAALELCSLRADLEPDYTAFVISTVDFPRATDLISVVVFVSIVASASASFEATSFLRVLVPPPAALLSSVSLHARFTSSGERVFK